MLSHEVALVGSEKGVYHRPNLLWVRLGSSRSAQVLFFAWVIFLPLPIISCFITLELAAHDPMRFLHGQEARGQMGKRQRRNDVV